MPPDPAATLAVAGSPLADLRALEELARRLELQFLGSRDPRRVSDFPYLLFGDEHGLGLQMTGKGAPGPVRVEFATGKAGYRLEHGGGTGQLVARAVGLKKTRQPLHVLDATAGLGQDAFVLAGLGCRVTMLERSAIVHALLADGLARGRLNPATAGVMAQMTLIHAESTSWLQAGESDLADVIYLDPMFPHRDKSALVKKEMRIFRDLVGADEDAGGLLAAALTRARYRVVVKRPRKAPAVEGPEPAARVEGKTSRYDIYPLRALPNA
ncbi:MAG: class I SAM-dependent methyltransferase [Marinobacter sp.]|uniref:class I SAM-dependent methyltransferase n=1 Tax=Marinobacter sp. TaxID=50741 RepID=UPI00299D636E|nr:class I SAM-dependent methyltransferase [Marinobacter sp.]MDX1634068.1 class I SAM-dependent methyltransferase [Marinobacter sp.]